MCDRENWWESWRTTILPNQKSLGWSFWKTVDKTKVTEERQNLPIWIQSCSWPYFLWPTGILNFFFPILLNSDTSWCLFFALAHFGPCSLSRLIKGASDDPVISEAIFVSCGWASIGELTVLQVDSVGTSQTERQHPAFAPVWGIARKSSSFQTQL